VRPGAEPKPGDQQRKQERSLQIRTTGFAFLEIVDASLGTPTGGEEIHPLREAPKKNEAT